MLGFLKHAMAFVLSAMVAMSATVTADPVFTEEPEYECEVSQEYYEEPEEFVEFTVEPEYIEEEVLVEEQVFEEPAEFSEGLDLSHYYANTGLIMEEPGDTVFAVMQNGNVFEFLNEGEDWFVGDIVSILFYDNGTDIVYDDIIISCRYSGWVSDEEMQKWVK